MEFEDFLHNLDKHAPSLVILTVVVVLLFVVVVVADDDDVIREEIFGHLVVLFLALLMRSWCLIISFSYSIASDSHLEAQPPPISRVEVDLPEFIRLMISIRKSTIWLTQLISSDRMKGNFCQHLYIKANEMSIGK